MGRHARSASRRPRRNWASAHRAVAIGADIIHAPSASARFGRVPDFHTAMPKRPGGVYLNCGSAVVLPEVFLKAVALAETRVTRWPVSRR